MLPATDATDHAIVQHASHQRFEELLEAGVEILEYDRTLLHQKVMVVDRIWSSVGSTNFDDRSFELNDEIQIGMLDRRIAAELVAAFERDAEHATVLTLEQWKRRSMWHRLIDRAAYLFNEQL
ncbi:MAG TPA: phospholipase D-like domain-containing protein [Thermoanaerobaculia bacterium]|nr:phospholipase D-like domain-containing protein [Thermoanaerobaculia bacterium]